MIRLIQLARTEITTSRLAFGTSRLHYLDRRERLDVLSAAADHGIIHFDTAPAYGDGLAEKEIGRFIRGNRDRFVIATKYGIPADPMIEALSFVAQPLRGIRALARRIGLWQHRRPLLTATGLRNSAERSLRRLGTDRIDILFLHEPELQRLRDPSEVLEEFTNLKQRGLIRAVGLAGAWAGIDTLRSSQTGLAEVLQTGEEDWPAEHPPDITYGAISRGSQSYFAPAVAAEAAAERLKSALERRPNGVVLVSTTKIDNLRKLAEVGEAQAV